MIDLVNVPEGHDTKYNCFRNFKMNQILLRLKLLRSNVQAPWPSYCPSHNFETWAGMSKVLLSFLFVLNCGFGDGQYTRSKSFRKAIPEGISNVAGPTRHALSFLQDWRFWQGLPKDQLMQVLLRARQPKLMSIAQNECARAIHCHKMPMILKKLTL